MYIPKYFQFEDHSEIRDFIKKNGFGILISQGATRILGTHIPLYLKEEDDKGWVLHGHISRANEQWGTFQESEEVLVIFSGPDTYISSSWYDHENVPTWNYIAVHVYGNLRIIGEQELLSSLKLLVDKYEKASDNPVTIEGMDQETLHRQMKGIVGFEIRITDVQAIRKLSQNRDQKNYDRVLTELEKKSEDSNALQIAEEMKKLKR